MEIKAGSTDQTIYFHLVDITDGSDMTGLVYNSSGLKAYYVLNRAAAAQITLATLAAATTAHADGGFKEVDATNMPGVYRLDLPDAAVATGPAVVVTISGFADLKAESQRIELVANTAADVIAATTAIETDTQDIQARLPASLTGAGLIQADVVRISDDATAANNAELFFDGTGYNAANSTIGTVTLATTTTTLTNLPAITANWLTAAGIAADVTTELQSGLATASMLTDVKTQTDKLTFTVANQIDANVQYVNDVAVTGDGEPGTEWGP